MKIYVLLGLAILAVFMAGRYTAPDKIVTRTVTVEVEKQVENKNTSKKEHKTTTITKAKDGTKKIVISDDTETRDQSNITKFDDKNTSTLSEETRRTNAINISVLAGAQKGSLATHFYGVSVNKQLLGPIIVGVFGFTNISGGISFGVSL